jgi:predicted tellurium resistance membrane protein TerC
MNDKTLTYLAYALAAVLLIVGVVYFTQAANHLPHFFPGYSETETKTHFKHGVAAIFLALGAVAFGWFKSGPKSTQE